MTLIDWLVAVLAVGCIGLLAAGVSFLWWYVGERRRYRQTLRNIEESKHA